MTAIHRGRVGANNPPRIIDPLAITHRQWKPRYESAPYRQHPGRREHIHGPILPKDEATNFVNETLAICFALLGIVFLINLARI